MRSIQNVQSRPLDAAVSASRYRLLVELGHGGMADVCLAVQLGSAGFRRLAVLKRLRAELSQDADFLEMFLQEARLAARLNHPNVVHTHEVGHDEECHFMALEYLQGHSYSAVLGRASRARYDFASSLRVLIESLKGLEYAHQLKDFDGTPLKVVHRDISPSNIFITYDGQIKILDFGIAKAMNSSVETKAGLLKGKISYMSPEHASSKMVDAQTDLYAVGVLLWEAAAGRRRWQGVPEVTVLRKLMTCEPPLPPDATSRGLPALVDAVCLRALAPDPLARFASAAEFRESLEEILETMGRRVSAEDVGRGVAEAFEEDRQNLQEAVEQELRKLQRDEDLTLSSLVQSVRQKRTDGGGRFSTGDPGIVIIGPNEPPASARPLDGPRTETRETELRPTRRAWLPWVLSGILLAIGGGAFVTYQRTAKLPPSLATSVSAALPAAPVTKTVAVRLKADPPQAKLSIDGKLLSANPYVADLPMSNGSVTVQAQAEGFATQSSVVQLDADRVVSFELVPLPSGENSGSTVPPLPLRGHGSAHKEPAATPASVPVKAVAAPASGTGATPDSAARKRSKAPVVVLDQDNPWQK
jgi:serine/threonine protein kinase